LLLFFKKENSFFLLLLSLLFIPGCQRNTLIVVAPQQAQPSPCRAPPGSRYQGLREMPDLMARVQPSVLALQAHMSGCAGLAFKLRPDGTPENPQVIVESPSGYGYGPAALRALLASRYQPRPFETGPHYVVFTVNMAPAGRPPQPGAPILPRAQGGPAAILASGP
jgi:hypothetical protein